MAEFKIGDAVAIIKYGRLYPTTQEMKDRPLIIREGGVYYYDMSPELVGRIATIIDIFPSDWEKYDTPPMYALDIKAWGIMEWFDKAQLQSIADYVKKD